MGIVDQRIIQVFLSSVLWQFMFLTSANAEAHELESRRVPAAFTFYAPTSEVISENSCQSQLEQARGFFDGISFNIDFKKWHQGNPNDPGDSPGIFSKHFGKIYIEPASEAFRSSLVACLKRAREMGFSPILIKIKLLDFQSFDNQGKERFLWRGMINFDPMTADFAERELGPVDLGLKILHDFRRQTRCGNCTDMILSFADEYVISMTHRPRQWEKLLRKVKDHLENWGFQSKLAVNLDWNTGWFVNLLNRWDLSRALKQVDLIGWSLYRPFLSQSVEGVRFEQRISIADLRLFLDLLDLRGKPQAIFEFGVMNRKTPHSWDPRSLNVEDQSNAYSAWLELLEEGKSPVSTIFAFWFGVMDPRLTIPHQLVRYRKATESGSLD